jgi:hypothetical protein
MVVLDAPTPVTFPIRQKTWARGCLWGIVILAALFAGLDAGVEYLEGHKLPSWRELALPIGFFFLVGFGFIRKVKYDSFVLYENGTLEAQPARFFGIPVAKPLKIRVESSNSLLAIEEGGTPQNRGYMLLLKTQGVAVPWVLARAQKAEYIETYARELAAHFKIDLKWVERFSSSPTLS